ncbi:hypothetical protein LPJ72_006318, partial [Coemansia sp. Benny D160-2]
MSSNTHTSKELKRVANSLGTFYTLQKNDEGNYDVYKTVSGKQEGLPQLAGLSKKQVGQFEGIAA